MNQETQRTSVDDERQDDSTVDEVTKSHVVELISLTDEKLMALKEDAKNLALRASSLYNLSAASRVVTIVLGALIATSGTAVKIWGEDSNGVLLIYTGLGVIVAAVGGLDAAFKLETRSAARRLLAADMTAKIEGFELRKKRIGVDAELEGEESQRTAELQNLAYQILEDLSEYIVYAHRQAAEVGVNLTRERLRGKKN